MKSTATYLACVCSLFVIGTSAARPIPQPQSLAAPDGNAEMVGDITGSMIASQKALQDTVWIADWNFDTGAPCSETGWTHVDNHILNDGVVWWHIETGFTTVTGMTGQSAAVGYHDRPCCRNPNGYDNDWYQGIRMTYTGNATLSLDYIVDSEAGFDFLQVETDSLCLSYARVDFNVNPQGSPAKFRTLEVSASGLVPNGEWVNEALSNYGAGAHCVYIAFFADGAYSSCDGDQPTTVGEGAVVDNIVLVDGSGTRSENFEDGTLNIGTFLNMADSEPFGTWARLFAHITDNDACQENTTCAWLFTDNTTPTLFNHPSMSFGPGGYVIKNWLDDIVVSPWVSLASTPTASGTVLSFRRFPGNNFTTSRIVQNWSVRGKGTIAGTPCVTGWGPASIWSSLSTFVWQSLLFDMTPYVDPRSESIQIRHRTSDWQWIAGASAPTSFIPGPGPYIDRVRIGRRVLTGPVISEGIDSRSQGQDCFPTEIHSGVTPAGEHYRPTTDRFGTCAFSAGAELGINRRSPNLITGDSVYVNVQGIRTGGTVVTSVTFSAAISAGPHIGKAPPPYTVGANGFFSFAADSVRSAGGSVLADAYFVDLDDTYFRGGDALAYFWAATDNGGGFTSDPVGLTGTPSSIAAAQTVTAGLFEVNFLPTINWAPAYLGRVAADPHGDLAPTAPELAASAQKNRICYVNNIVSRRRSGDLHRTSFMYTLDILGYRDHYDVYDHQGMGNTNNQLGGRATIEQCQGYRLLVYDNGNGKIGRPLLPDGVNIDSEKVDQAGWFRNWLDQVPLSEAGYASLWIIGSNTCQEKPTNALITTSMGVTFMAPDQALNINPMVDGVASFTFEHSASSETVDFTTDLFQLDGGCPEVRNYDAIGAIGAAAVQTHRYRSPTTGSLGGGAVVMNHDNTYNRNTIMMTFNWADIPDVISSEISSFDSLGIEGEPSQTVAAKVVAGTLEPGDEQTADPTDSGAEDRLAVPGRTRLYPNSPNPFNPLTTIRFDLGRAGHVTLNIYAADGHLVRRLIDADMPAGANLAQVWDGMDDSGIRIGSGVYFCRLDTVDGQLVAKMVHLK